MEYQKDCTTTIRCWNREQFFNNKKKIANTTINLNYNKFIGTKNSSNNQVVVLKLEENELYIPVYDLKAAINLLEDIHKAGRWDN